MPGGTITSRRNPRITAAAALSRARERRATGLTLLEGPNVLESAAVAGADVVEVFATIGDTTPERLGLDSITTWVGEDVLKAVSTTTSPRGPVAILRIGKPPALACADTLVVWGVGDPGNVGTLIRSAAAFGLQIGIGGASADIWSPKVLRAAAGAHFATALVPIMSPLDELAVAGIISVATVVAGGAAPEIAFAGPGPKGIMVGSEARGLPNDLVEGAENRVTLELDGRVESLNAGVAGSIVAYELARSR